MGLCFCTRPFCRSVARSVGMCPLTFGVVNVPPQRTSQPPQGIWQFRPANKFSVPEDFCPFVRGGDEE